MNFLSIYCFKNISSQLEMMRDNSILRLFKRKLEMLSVIRKILFSNSNDTLPKAQNVGNRINEFSSEKSIDISFPISCIKSILFINFKRLDCQVPIVNKLYKYRCERWLYSSQILYVGYTAYFRVHSAAVLSCSGLFVFNFCRIMLR